MTLRDSASFERDVVRALWAGAAAGALHALFLGLLGPLGRSLPAWPFVSLAVPLAFAIGAGRGRVLLVLAALLAPMAGLTTTGFGSALLAGAVTGGALCAARRFDGLEDRFGARVVAGLFVGGALGVAGEAVAGVFTLRLGALLLPELLVSVVACTAAALFLALGALPALLVLAPDVVGDKARALIAGSADARLRSLLTRTLEAHRRCRALLAALPRDEGRIELSRSVEALTAGVAEQAERLSLARVGFSEDEAAGEAEARRLEAEQAGTEDPLARQHLRLALQVAREGLERARTASVERTRLWARLEAEVALLDRTRTTLEDVRGGHAAVRAAELTALSRKLDALARREALEADVLAEVALGAELDQLAAQTARSTGTRG